MKGPDYKSEPGGGEPEEIVIIAVAHLHRKPGYWMGSRVRLGRGTRPNKTKEMLNKANTTDEVSLSVDSCCFRYLLFPLKAHSLFSDLPCLWSLSLPVLPGMQGRSFSPSYNHLQNQSVG